MFEYLSLMNLYQGPRIYANANPNIANDGFPGTADKPVLTLSEAIDRIEPNTGSRIIATSSMIHDPPNLYAFTENVTLNKSITALTGRFAIKAGEGAGLTLSLDGILFNCLVIGATIYGTGMGEAFLVRNNSYSIIADCFWVNADTSEQIGFALRNDGGPFSSAFGGNGFINCRASGGDFADTKGFELQDEGDDTNFVIDCAIGKCNTGISIANSALQGSHVISNNRFDACNTPLIQADALHSWFLYGNYYSDVPPGYDATGKEAVWPNSSATWTFANPDPRPISNVGAIYSNKMMSGASSTMIRQLLFRNIQAGGFGKAP